MTRKDYVAVAAAILRTRDFIHAEIASEPHRIAALAAVGLVTDELADVFAADNSRFDRGRFDDAARTGAA